jgi:hypothetical protein
MISSRALPFLTLLLVACRKTGFGGPRLSPDERRVLYSDAGGGRKRELWVMTNLPGARTTGAAASGR